MTREERNSISYMRWKDAGFVGTLIAPPRYGKTRYVISIIHTIAKKFIPETPNILVVVRSAAVRQQWLYEKELYEDTNYVNLTFNVVSITEAINMLHSKYYLVVFDEVHRFTTFEGKKLISKQVFDYRFAMALTGTPPFDKDDIEFLNKHLPIYDTITKAEAVSNGWILNKIEVNLVLELSDGDKLSYERFSHRITDIMNKYKGIYKKMQIPFIPNDFTLIRSLYTGVAVPIDFQDMTNDVKYISSTHIVEAVANLMGWSTMLDHDDPINALWNPNIIHEECKLYMDFVRLRNDIIINNRIKEDAVMRIAELFDEPTICFNESIEFAEKLADNLQYKGINTAVYHGSIKSRPMINPDTNKPFTYKTGAKKGQVRYFGKKSILIDTVQGLNEGRYRFLSTVKALDEGVNIPNLVCVICTSGTMNPIPYIQRTERASTVCATDKQPIVFNLVFNDFYLDASTDGYSLVKSRDLTKLRSRQIAAKTSPVWVYGLNELIDVQTLYYSK